MLATRSFGRTAVDRFGVRRPKRLGTMAATKFGRIVYAVHVVIQSLEMLACCSIVVRSETTLDSIPAHIAGAVIHHVRSPTRVDRLPLISVYTVAVSMSSRFVVLTSACRRMYKEQTPDTGLRFIQSNLSESKPVRPYSRVELTDLHRIPIAVSSERCSVRDDWERDQTNETFTLSPVDV